jgi:hypothetical protein
MRCVAWRDYFSTRRATLAFLAAVADKYGVDRGVAPPGGVPSLWPKYFLSGVWRHAVGRAFCVAVVQPTLQFNQVTTHSTLGVGVLKEIAVIDAGMRGMSDIIKEAASEAWVPDARLSRLSALEQAPSQDAQAVRRALIISRIREMEEHTMAVQGVALEMCAHVEMGAEISAEAGIIEMARKAQNERGAEGAELVLTGGRYQYSEGALIPFAITFTIHRVVWTNAAFNHFGDTALTFLERLKQRQKKAVSEARIPVGVVRINNSIRKAELINGAPWPDSGTLYIAVCRAIKRLHDGEVVLPNDSVISGAMLCTRDTSFKRRMNNFQAVSIVGDRFVVRISLPGVPRGVSGKAGALSVHITISSVRVMPHVVSQFLADFMAIAGFPGVECVITTVPGKETGQASVRLPFVVETWSRALTPADRPRELVPAVQGMKAWTPQLVPQFGFDVASRFAMFLTRGEWDTARLPCWVRRRYVSRTLKTCKWFTVHINESVVVVGQYSRSILLSGRATETDFIAAAIAFVVMLWELLKRRSGDIAPLEGLTMEDTENLVAGVPREVYHRLNFRADARSMRPPALGTRPGALIVTPSLLGDGVGVCIHNAVIRSLDAPVSHEVVDSVHDEEADYFIGALEDVHAVDEFGI